MTEEIKSYLERIAARMLNENFKNLSDKEIERTLRGCVAGKGLIRIAKQHKPQLKNMLNKAQINF